MSLSRKPDFMDCRFQIEDRRLKNLRILLALIVAVVLTCGAARIASAGEVIDRVVAIVAGELIMLSDVNAVRTLGLSSAASSASADEVVNRLIDRSLVLSEIERYSPPEPAPAMIEQGMQEVRNRFSTQASFDEALARVGFSERRLRQNIRQDLRITAYEQQRFTAPTPSDEDAQRFYQEHRDRFAATFADAREQVQQEMLALRRATLVSDWVAGLRRRAQIVKVTER